MTHFVSLLRLRVRLLRRWSAENAFTLVVMAPLVIGGSALIFQPYLDAAGRAVRSTTASMRWIPEHAAALAGVLFVAVVIARLSSAIRDVFAVAADEFTLDALPIEPVVRFHDVLVLRLAKAVPVLVSLVLVALLSAPHATPARETIGAVLPTLVAGAAILALVEVAAALVLVRLRLATASGVVAIGIAAVGACFVVGQVGVWVLVGIAVVGYAIGVRGFQRWRVEYRDAAREALARAKRTSPALERLSSRVFGSTVGSQVVRDLRLIVRGFSTTPFAAAGVAVILPGTAVWVAGRFAFEPLARIHLVESAVVLSAFSFASITHALVGYERRRAWIDLTSGVPFEDFPRAKIWTGRLVASPSVVLGMLAAIASGAAWRPLEVVQLVWLTWSTATLVSILCYELKERPLAGLVLAFLPAAGIPLLTVFYGPGDVMWFFALFGYVYATFNLGSRASAKVEWER